MKPFSIHTGQVAPLDRENVDTDAIIPKQFMKSIERTGFGTHLFDAWRYLDEVEPGEGACARQPNPTFVLNQPRYRGASVLLAGRNFGCGSSREHAPWALSEYGFRVLIAPSFAEIFLNNCMKNGLLPIELAASDVALLFREVDVTPGFAVTVDLERQVVIKPDGVEHAFQIDLFRKHCLVNGLDDIDLTLLHAQEIRAFENTRLRGMPWLGKRVR